MTTVRMLFKTPADGVPAPASGQLRWQPTARRVIPASGAIPAAVVLPEAFTVPLVAGAADIQVEPSSGSWVWTVVESFAGSPSRRRYLAVPDVVSVDYADLIETDPNTLDPALNVTPDPGNPGFYLIGA